MYLDYKGERPARPRLTVSWQDKYGNSHLLDYVLERGGTETTLGVPIAFIETAFRRYTKHSKNKAQEIEGAVVPLADTYSHVHPFCGAILAGVFTSNSLNQLRSRGFEVIYIPHEEVQKAFSTVGIDAGCDESTPDEEFQHKVDSWDRLSEGERTAVKLALVEVAKPQTIQFIAALNASLARQIQSVTVTVLHGRSHDVITVDEAIRYNDSYSETALSNAPASKIDTQVRYSNGDAVGGVFHARTDAIDYLKKFL